jgi:hypothetical protein
MTDDRGLMKISTRNSLLHKFATRRSVTPLNVVYLARFSYPSLKTGGQYDARRPR